MLDVVSITVYDRHTFNSLSNTAFSGFPRSRCYMLGGTITHLLNESRMYRSKTQTRKTQKFKSSQVKLSFIVIPLHVGTYSGTKCRASQDHGAT